MFLGALGSCVVHLGDWLGPIRALESLWGLMGASWEALGRSWALFGAAWELLVELLGRCWGFLGFCLEARRSILALLGRSWVLLGGSLGTRWVSWDSPWASCRSLEVPWCSWGLLRCSWVLRQPSLGLVRVPSVSFGFLCFSIVVLV